MLAGANVAATSNDAIGCTFENTRYELNDLVHICDTTGLNESRVGKLIRDLAHSGGIDLLVFVVRGGPGVMSSTVRNYELFYEAICWKEVPIVVVITGLEYEQDMDVWWKRNEQAFRGYGMVFHGHACITAIRGKKIFGRTSAPKEYDRSKKTLEDLISTRMPWVWSRAPWRMSPAVEANQEGFHHSELTKVMGCASLSFFAVKTSPLVGGCVNTFCIRSTSKRPSCILRAQNWQCVVQQTPTSAALMPRTAGAWALQHDLPELIAANRPAYTDYTSTSLTNRIVDGSTTIVTLLREVAAVIPAASPLCQVLGVTKELLFIVTEMRDIREGCEHLIERILLFVKNLVEEFSQMNMPIRQGTPTAARLYALALNIKAIKDDAERWKEWSHFERFMKRAAIKSGLSRHNQNLTDCFQTFAARTLLQLGTIADGAAPAPSIIPNDSPQDSDDSPAGSSRPAIQRSSSSSHESESMDIQRLIRHSAGRTMFGQINLAVRSSIRDTPNNSSQLSMQRSNSVVASVLDNKTVRLDANCNHASLEVSPEAAIGVSETALDSQSPQSSAGPASSHSAASAVGSDVAVYRFALGSNVPTPRAPSPADDHLYNLVDRVGNLTLKVIDHLPNVNDDLVHTGGSSVEYTPSIYQAGRPTRQLDKTIQDTFELLDELQDTATQFSEEVLAQKMSDLSLNMHDLGLDEGVLEVQTFCVVIYHGLAEQHDFQPLHSYRLAISLDHLSNYLSDLGNREQALFSAEEAVEICRRLTTQDPPRYQADLSRSLNNISLRLSDVGRHREALNAIQEALGLRRQLAEDDPDLFNADLARTLDNLSHRLSNLGFRDQALNAAQEAVELHLRMTEDDLPVSNPDLAVSLCNLSKCFSDLGSPDQALYVMQESIELHQQLASTGSAAFDSHHATALIHLSKCLSDLGRPDSALAAIQEAVAIHRRLAAGRPTAFNPHLARSLGHLSSQLSRLGNHDPALNAIEEAVKLHRAVAAQIPAVFNADLAISLEKLSLRLSDLGRHQQALVAIKEATELHRALAAERPAVFDTQLATSLLHLSKCHSSLGDWEKALQVAQDAVALRRLRAADYPDSFTSHLAISLGLLSERLPNVGGRERGLDAIREAVHLYRALAADQPARFRPGLASMLLRLSESLSHSGNPENALEAAQESALLYRQLAVQEPTSFNADLALSLRRLCVSLSAVNHREESLEVIQESVELYRQLAKDDPTSFEPRLAKSLGDLSVSLSNLGRWAEALGAVEQVVEVHRRLAAEFPAQYNSSLTSSCKSLAKCLRKMGRKEEARAVARESLRLEPDGSADEGRRAAS